MADAIIQGFRSGSEQLCIDNQATTGAGSALQVADDQDVVATIDTDGGGDAALTVLFQISNQSVEPDWGAAQSAANRWTYCQVIDYFDGSAKNGNVGIAAASADVHKQVEFNTNGMKWANATVSARTVGEVTVYLKAFNNK